MNHKQKVIRTFLFNIKNSYYPLLAYNKSNSFTTTALTKFENRNLLRLKERGLVVGIFPDQTESFNKLISSGLQTCYCGFDPTASSLHIGNLLALIFLLHCQRSGHNPIVVIGSATALIGDPSGRATERNKIENTTLLANTEKIQKTISQIFKNHEELFWKAEKKNEGIILPKLKILNNIKWYENVNIIQFLSNYGKHFRMGDLLSRKQIETRLASSDGISYTEFSYQMFQAYDWLHLNKTYNCNIQVGGNDQTGNMKTGYELISKVLPKSNTFSIAIPLVTTEKGEKLGKSAGNAVWIDEELMSPFEFFQFFVNVSDQMVESYLKIFTFMSISEIEDTMKKHRLKPELFTAQKKLASNLTRLVHGEEGLQSALKCTSAFFLSDRESMAKMSHEEIESTFRSAKVVTLTMEPGLTVAECALKAKCFKTLDLAMHIIKAGGFRMNHTLITNPQEALIFGQHILSNNISVIRIGKKTYYLVKWLA